MRTKIILVLACAAIASPAVALAKTTRTTKANPLETPAPTPLAEIQTVTGFTPEQPSIEVVSSPQTRSVKYILAKKVSYVDTTGKRVDPKLIRPGTRVRLESKSKGIHGKFRRVVVIQPQRA